MKRAKIVLLIGFILSLCSAKAQTTNLIGNWQLVSQSNCLEEAANNQDEEAGIAQNRAAVSQQIVSFKANASGEESTQILNSGRGASQKKFYYKFNGEMLLILDKKSQTVSASYSVDKFTSDSLIVSNTSRPCEVRIFVKITEASPN